MLLASRNNANDGTFNGEPEYVKRFAYLNKTPDFKPLIQYGFIELVHDASNVLAKCNTEESRGEKEESKAEENNAEQVGLIFNFWKQTLNHPKAVLDAKRKKLIEARLKDGYPAKTLCNAISGCSLSPYHMGFNDSGTKYDGLDLIFRDAGKVDQFIGYFDKPPKPVGNQARIESINESSADQFLNGENPFSGHTVEH
jgi:hypothetical protein